MNKQELSQYRAIKNEIKTLENRLDKLSMRKYKYGVDTVSSSSRSIPYEKYNMTISGYGFDSIDDGRKHNLIKRIKSRLQDLHTEFEAIQAFIDSIDDSEIRQIIEYKYIEKLSWNATATKLYGYPCGDRARKKFERF